MWSCGTGLAWPAFLCAGRDCMHVRQLRRLLDRCGHGAGAAGAPVSGPHVAGVPSPCCQCVSGAAGRAQPLPPPTECSSTSPTLTVAFCFLGDTSIRRCVRVTNLLQARQLSQGGLTRQAGKADTVVAAGSQAFQLLSPRYRADL